MNYTQDEYLALSGIQHFAFCRRQWALIHIEQQWAENLRTIEGELLHERAHDKYFYEKRGDILVSRGMAVHSATLGVSGECDIVEFHRTEDGVALYGREGLYQAYPVEYKRGKPKEEDVDIVQLVAQAMCLEEMLCCEITSGFLYYGETRHRVAIEITDELRQRVSELFAEMHSLYKKRYTPKVRRTKRCNACSLKDICLPALMKHQSAADYMSERLRREEA